MLFFSSDNRTGNQTISEAAAAHGFVQFPHMDLCTPPNIKHRDQYIKGTTRKVILSFSNMPFGERKSKPSLDTVALGVKGILGGLESGGGEEQTC